MNNKQQIDALTDVFFWMDQHELAELWNLMQHVKGDYSDYEQWFIYHRNGKGANWDGYIQELLEQYGEDGLQELLKESAEIDTFEYDDEFWGEVTYSWRGMSLISADRAYDILVPEWLDELAEWLLEEKFVTNNPKIDSIVRAA